MPTNSFDSKRIVEIVTPARVCLFGDHQDYLGLPIIAGAINRYMRFEATLNDTPFIKIHMPDIHESRIIYLNENFTSKTGEIDFLLAGLRVVKKVGCHPNKGFVATIKSEIPLNAGVSSSSALVVGWIHLLLELFGADVKVESELIARLAYEAEVLEHNSPGGKMDQYTISLGHLLYLETGDSLQFQTFEQPLSHMILVESGIPKETLGTLRNIRALSQEAIELVREFNPNFILEDCSLEEMETNLKILPKQLQPYFRAAITNHDITQKALNILRKDHLDLITLGALMSQHHRVLKELLNVSHPSIDKILDIALDQGAYGGKIVGSGGGGCAVILTAAKFEHNIIDALLKSGVKNAYPIAVSSGTYSKRNG
jgi:galactokinase